MLNSPNFIRIKRREKKRYKDPLFSFILVFDSIGMYLLHILDIINDFINYQYRILFQ